jgi:uncharacterized protein YfiM (DUF2279 family)
LLAAAEPQKPDREKVIQGARVVVASIVRAGKSNKAREQPITGDELTALYVRAAIVAARDLPALEAMPALNLGLGVAMDSSSLMRYNPVVGQSWRRVETNAERTARLAVLGEPTMYSRHDLAQHFFVSAALTALLGAKPAEAAGVVKEILDAQEGGSGFSFADLAADLAGVHFASRLIDRPERARAIEKGFRVKDFAIGPKGLDEGMAMKEFEKRYGGTADARYKKQRDDIVRRVRALPGYQDPE